MTRWDPYLSPLVAVIATTLVGVLITGRRLPRVARWLWGYSKWCCSWVWHNTRIVLWTGLTVGTLLNAYELRQIAEAEARSNAILCLSKKEVTNKLAQNRIQLRYQYEFGLSAQDVLSIKRNIAAQQNVLILLRRVECD